MRAWAGATFFSPPLFAAFAEPPEFPARGTHPALLTRRRCPWRCIKFFPRSGAGVCWAWRWPCLCVVRGLGLGAAAEDQGSGNPCVGAAPPALPALLPTHPHSPRPAAPPTQCVIRHAPPMSATGISLALFASSQRASVSSCGSASGSGPTRPPPCGPPITCHFTRPVGQAHRHARCCAWPACASAWTGERCRACQQSVPATYGIPLFHPPSRATALKWRLEIDHDDGVGARAHGRGRRRPPNGRTGQGGSARKRIPPRFLQHKGQNHHFLAAGSLLIPLDTCIVFSTCART